MKLTLKFILIIGLLFSLSCTNNKSSDFEVIESNIISITGPKTSISGEKVQIEVQFYGRNGCSTPFNITAATVGQTVTLQAYYKYPEDGRNCTEILPLHELTYTFFADYPGVYFFESKKDPTIRHTLTVY